MAVLWSGSVRSVFLGPPGSGSICIFTNLDPFINKQKRKNFISTLFCHFILTFYLRRLMSMYFQKVISRKTYCFLTFCQPLTKKAGSGSVSQWYGSADLDPYQNVNDAKHCLLDCSLAKVPVPVPSIPFTLNQ